MQTSTQNINSKLRPNPKAPRGTGVSWSASAIQSSAPPVRIVGARARYQGGYRVNV
jgi:hypothetical protein